MRFQKDFEIGRHGRAAGDDRPELPSQGAVDAAEPPPLFQDRKLFGTGQFLRQIVESAQQMGTEKLQHARNGDKYRDPLATNQLGHAARFQLVGEMDLAGQERRQPEAHELAEDVAKGQSVQKTKRMHPALVFPVFPHFALDGTHAGKNVRVSVDDAFRLGGGAGSEDDLKGSGRDDRFADIEIRFRGQI